MGDICQGALYDLGGGEKGERVDSNFLLRVEGKKKEEVLYVGGRRTKIFSRKGRRIFTLAEGGGRAASRIRGRSGAISHFHARKGERLDFFKGKGGLLWKIIKRWCEKWKTA